MTPDLSALVYILIAVILAVVVFSGCGGGSCG